MPMVLAAHAYDTCAYGAHNLGYHGHHGVSLQNPLLTLLKDATHQIRARTTETVAMLHMDM